MQLEKILLFLKVVIIVCSVFLLMSGFSWTYGNILEPAYVSTVESCGLKTTEEINDMGYFIAAKYFINNDSIKVYIPSDADIEAYKKTKEYQMALRHEICHRNQANENRLSGCGLNIFGFPGARMIDEIECYIKQYF